MSAEDQWISFCTIIGARKGVELGPTRAREIQKKPELLMSLDSAMTSSGNLAVMHGD